MVLKKIQKKRIVKVKKTLSSIIANEVNISRKEVIFIDLDGTIADSIGGALKEINSDYLPSEYDVNKWDVSEEDKKYVLSTFTNLDFLAKVKPFPWSKTLVNLLSEKYELIILTARPQSTHNLTEAYCKIHFPEVKHVLFASKEEPKHDIINKFDNAKAFIDDCPKYLMEVVDKCIMSGKSDLSIVIAIDGHNQPYTLLDWQDEFGDTVPLKDTEYRYFVTVANLYKIIFLITHN